MLVALFAQFTGNRFGDFAVGLVIGLAIALLFVYLSRVGRKG